MYPRPVDQGNFTPVVNYGANLSDEDTMTLRRVNAQLGRNSQIHILFILSNKDQSVVTDILNAWKGPNKNELLVFVGVNDNHVRWCEVHSWMDNTTLHGLITQDVLKGLDIQRISNNLLTLVPQYWVRKEFKDFDYLSVPISLGWYIAAVILILSACIGNYFIIEHWFSCTYDYPRRFYRHYY
jgi:hypothetical protein